MQKEKKALGRGLSALIPERETTYAAAKENNVIEIKVQDINPNRFQPREEFNKESFEELVGSIKEKGIIQPLLVRKIPGGYELIAGERRLRAAKQLNLKEVPAVVREDSDLDSLEVSLIENIQREDLNPIEQAKAYKRLMEEFNLSQEKVADAVGKERPTVANIIRLLKLPLKIQEYVSHGTISMGHARAILSLNSESEQLRLCTKVIKNELSVRDTESYIKKILTTTRQKGIPRDPNLTSIEEELQDMLGTKVKIIKSKKGGRIEIDFYSDKDLERVVTILKSKT